MADYNTTILLDVPSRHKTTRQKLTQPLLKRLLSYDPDSGLLKWKIRPP